MSSTTMKATRTTTRRPTATTKPKMLTERRRERQRRVQLCQRHDRQSTTSEKTTAVVAIFVVIRTATLARSHAHPLANTLPGLNNQREVRCHQGCRSKSRRPWRWRRGSGLVPKTTPTNLLRLPGDSIHNGQSDAKCRQRNVERALNYTSRAERK